MRRSLAIFFCLIWMPFLALAQNKVAVLLAIQNVDSYGADRAIYEQLAILANQELKGFDVRVVYHATQDDLYAQLNDPTNRAVFWLSHAGANRSDRSQSVNNVILDSKGANVAPLFQKIDSHVQWVGVVGCEAKSILDNTKSTYGLKQRFFGFSSVVRPLSGMRAALLDFKNFVALTGETENGETPAQGLVLEVRRPMRGPSLQIFFQGRFIGLASPYQQEEIEKILIPLPPQAQGQEFLIRVDSGLNPLDLPQFELEKMDLFLPDRNEFLERVELNHRPIGSTSQLYRSRSAN